MRRRSLRRFLHQHGCPVASSAAAADDGEILIGCLQDITGNTSGLGLSVQKGAQAAVDEINANGGINGKKIVMNTYDTKGDVTELSTPTSPP